MIQRTNVGLGIVASVVALIALLLAVSTPLYDAHAPWEGARDKLENASEPTVDSENKKTASSTSTPNIDATVEARVKQEIAAQPTATPVVVVKESTPTLAPEPTATPVVVVKESTPTLAPEPTATLTSVATPAPTPVPTPTPVGLLDAFTYSVSPSVTISSVVHSFRWQINSNYQEDVTVISGYIQTDDGQLVGDFSNSHVLASGGWLKWTTAFTLRFFTVSEVARFQPVWTIETQNNRTIVCKFNTSAKPCQVSATATPSQASTAPTPIPFLQAISSNLEPENIVFNPVANADVVLSFLWVLKNDSDESLNIVSGAIETPEGQLVVQTSLNEIMQVVPPGGRYTKSIYPTYQYTEDELNKFDIEWYLISGSEGVIVCESTNIGGTVCAPE